MEEIISPVSNMQTRFDVAHASIGLIESGYSEKLSKTVFKLQFIAKDFTFGVFSIFFNI